MYIDREYNGIFKKEHKALEIFKYINAESTNGYEIKQTYLALDRPKKIFTKEVAKDVMFKFLYEGKVGKEIGKELGNDKEVGFTVGQTLAYLGLGFRPIDKEAGIKSDNQRGSLKKQVSPEEAKRLISELVEYVYE